MFKNVYKMIKCLQNVSKFKRMFGYFKNGYIFENV